jgi:hypothetical protein
VSLFSRLSPLCAALALVWLIAPASLADNYQGLLFTGSDEQSRRNPGDLERITANYKGPVITSEKAATLRALIAFTLYPDGTVRWFRPAPFKGQSLDRTDPIYVAYMEAIRKSAPLKLAQLAQVKFPSGCTLSLIHPWKKNVLSLATDDVVLVGKFVITDGSSKNDDEVKADREKINSNLPMSKAELSAMNGAVVAMWFLANPDGTVEDFKSHVVVKPVRTKLRDVQNLLERMRFAVTQSAPLPAVIKSSYREPQGRLLIFNAFAPVKLTLHAVDSRSRKMDISFKPASTASKQRKLQK